MKRTGLISILLGLGILNAYPQDSIVSIPDTAFLYTLIHKGVDTNGDSLISSAEAEKVTVLDFSNWNITDMTGIGAFVNMDSLICDAAITILDVSNCISLTTLRCTRCILWSE